MFKWRKPSRSQMRFVSAIHDRFAGLAAADLSILLRSPVHMRVVSVEQLAYDKFVRSVSTPATFAMINMEPFGKVVMGIDPALDFAMVDRLCGGAGKLTTALHELTYIGASIMEGVVVRILKSAREAWKPIMDSNPILEYLGRNFPFEQIAPPLGKVILVGMETGVGDVKGKINFCIPYSIIEGGCASKVGKEDVPVNPADGTNEQGQVFPELENDLAAKISDIEKTSAKQADETEKLRQDFLELRNDLTARISDIEKGSARQAESPETDIIASFSLAVKNHIDNVVDIIRLYVDRDDQSKVAIFLVALGSKLSTEIFRHLREDECEWLLFRIARLERVERSQKTEILEEFHDLYTSNLDTSIGGINYARVLLEGSIGAKKTAIMINRLTNNLQVRPFDFIRRTDPACLLDFVRQEHPQVIALVLAYLSSNKASFILQKLPANIQSDVARRIATMDRTGHEVLREVERVFEKKLSTLSGEDYSTAGGVESIADILNLVDRASEKRIIETLEDEAPELAEEIKKRMFIFEDIVLLSDRDIQKIMREVDSQELSKALKSVESEVQEKIFRNMSKSAATMLKEDMEYMGPIRLKDVEEAQQKIVAIIRKLQDDGEIITARSDEDDVMIV